MVDLPHNCIVPVLSLIYKSVVQYNNSTVATLEDYGKFFFFRKQKSASKRNVIVHIVNLILYI